jgi:trigger factor
MVVRKDIDNSSAIVTVTITREELKPKLDAELKRFRQRAPMKGFRPGQAPIEFVKKIYGASIFGDTLNDMMATKLYDYLRESKLEVLGQPLPTADQQQFSFKISNPDPEYAISYEVGFVPAFDIKGLDKSESFERITVSNLDELAADDLNYARKRMGKRSTPETDIQENDIVRIASRELGGDQIKTDGWETTITVHLKSMKDSDLKAQLLSLKKGDTLRFDARQIENQEKEENYRKYILNLEAADDRVVGDLFEGVIEEVNRVEDAELNEEFYNGYFGPGNVSNETEAIEQIKKGITQFYDVRSNALLMRSFQERLIVLNQVELPETFLKRWLKMTNEGKLPEEQIETEYPAFAENLRWSMLRDKIKEQFGLEVSDEELYQEYVKRVRNYFQVEIPDNIISSSVESLMKNEKDVESTRRDLETDKIFQAVLGQVSVSDRAVPSDEFHKILDEITKKAEAEQEEDATLRSSVEEV